MNFLAHLYLSGNNDEVKFGNFIGDAVKGRDYEKFSPDIQKGIKLHRLIDMYTDKHRSFINSRSLLSEKYPRHSGIIVDIYYDHFLSLNWDKYCPIPRRRFIRDAYMLLAAHYTILPPRVKRYMPFMILNNWLGSYDSVEGLEQILSRMSKRTSLPEETEFAVQVLKDNYPVFNADFLELFNDLNSFAEAELAKMNS